MKEVVILRVDREGKAVTGSASAEGWVARSGSRLCHQVVGARAIDGSPICTKSCAAELAQGKRPGHVSQLGVVRGEVVRLNCHHVGDEAVVSVETTGQPAPAKRELLTPRELQVLALIARGQTTEDVAMQLGLRGNTVRTHVEHLCRRMGVRTRAQAVAVALATGQLKPESEREL